MWWQPGGDLGAAASSQVPLSFLWGPWLCVRLLHMGRHARVAWPLAGTGLRRGGRAMVGRICCVESEGVATVGSGQLLAGLGGMALIFFGVRGRVWGGGFTGLGLGAFWW